MNANEQNNQTPSTEEKSSAQSTPENGSTQPEQEKRFSQSDVDRIVKERLKRAERAADSTQTDAINTRRAELTQRENRLECREYLLNSGYSPELLEILDTTDPEQFKTKASKLQRLIDVEKRKAMPKAPPFMANQNDVPSGKTLGHAFDRNAKHKPKAYPPTYDD